MDEPFGALDAQTRVLLQEELERIWEADAKTVVFITHDIEEALFLADRVLVMSARPGRVIADITVDAARPRREQWRAAPEFAAAQGRHLEAAARRPAGGAAGGSRQVTVVAEPAMAAKPRRRATDNKWVQRAIVWGALLAIYELAGDRARRLLPGDDRGHRRRLRRRSSRTAG